MSTIKISQLPTFSGLNSNTAQSYFVSVDSVQGLTGKIQATSIAKTLYANTPLMVGPNPITFSNTSGQFSGSDPSFLQVNNQNFNSNGSVDYIGTADTGTNSTYYVDMGIAGSKYNYPGYTVYGPLDSYLLAQGALTAGQPGGNLVIGTVTTDRNIVFFQGGSTSSNIIYKVTASGIVLNTSKSMVFGDGTYQNTASANTIANQNINATQNTLINNIQGVDLTQNTLISNIQGVDNTQNTNIQYAWNLANTSLQNTTTITTAGNLQVSGNIQILGVGATGLFTINAIPYAANTPAFKITGSANTGYSQAPLNQGYMMQITGFANTSSRIVNDTFGANAYPAFIGRSARGSVISPAATANGDILLRLSGNGWANSFSQFGQSRIDFVATENFTDTNKGTEIQIWNTTVGTNTLNKIATFNANEVNILGHLFPQKGFIWYPRTFPAAQTSVTIDFSADSVIRTNTSSGLTVSFANYTTGKVVDMWITNISGTNQTFTHGCTALNSTVNATTYTMPGTSTIYVKYISFATDVANTFVSVVHA